MPGPVQKGPVENGPTGAQPPASVRQLQTPAALALGDLAAIFEDLTTVVGCCQLLLAELAQEARPSNPLVVESLWTTALVSYHRAFTPGPRGMGLTEADLTATGLEGDVADWHKLLGRLRAHYVDAPLNPRERFVVGVAQGADGTADGIAITSAVQPQVDQLAVQQTGRLAVELCRVVDERIKTQQENVFKVAKAMTPKALNALPAVDVAPVEQDGTDGG